MKRHRQAWAIVACIATVVVGAQVGRVGAAVVEFDYHDGTPAYPLGVNSWNLLGSFMYPIEPEDDVFYIEEVRFYHSGDYPDAGQLYDVVFCYRDEIAGEYYLVWAFGPFATQCNDCWETIDFYSYPVAGNPSTQAQSWGVFIRSWSGTIVHPAPVLWVDRYVNHQHISTLFDIVPTKAQALAQEFGDLGPRDELSSPDYLSDHGIGEVLITVVVSWEGTTGVESSSLSAIKSLY